MPTLPFAAGLGKIAPEVASTRLLAHERGGCVLAVGGCSRGDRLYLRAEVEYASGIGGIVQILGPPGFYRSDRIESLDGPATGVIQIDELVKSLRAKAKVE